MKVCVPIALLVIGVTLGLPTHAQVARKLLPRTINVPTYDHFCPQTTADGQEMIFLSTYSNTGLPTLRYTRKNGSGWTVPEDVNGLFKAELDMATGFGWSYDGQTMVISSRRAPGIGGYDLWISERRGQSTFAAPVNLGKPVNSVAHDAAPYLSADGKSMVFMRCKEASRFGAEGCSLYITTKSGGRWAEPSPLPASINQGNSQYPKLLADGNTLYFSSDQHGGKGGMELLMSRRSGDSWSAPVLLDFLNDGGDNTFVSVPGTGDAAVYSGRYRGEKRLIMARIPEAFQPNKVYLIKGQVTLTDATGSPDCMVQVYDAQSRELITGLRTEADGSFFVIMPEGKQYDVSAYPIDNKHTFYSAVYDLREMRQSDWEKREIKLEPIQSGTRLLLRGVRFEPYDSTLSATSTLELLRLTKLLRQQAGRAVEIRAYITEYKTDSVPSEPDLNLAQHDTLFFSHMGVETHRPVTTTAGLPEDNEETDKEWEEWEEWVEADEDTTIITEEMPVDSLVNSTPAQAEEPAIIVNTTWHNDRSAAYARAVRQFLLDQGAPATLVKATGLRDKYPEDLSTQGVNYFVEVVFD